MLLSDIPNKAEGSTDTSVSTNSADLAEGDQS
jgi:hypothetical protein